MCGFETKQSGFNRSIFKISTQVIDEIMIRVDKGKDKIKWVVEVKVERLDILIQSVAAMYLSRGDDFPTPGVGSQSQQTSLQMVVM